MGQCPYCDGCITNSMPEKSPAFFKSTCPECKQQYWLLASRIQSIAYTEEGFHEEYEVDEETKTVKEKGGGE